MKAKRAWIEYTIADELTSILYVDPNQVVTVGNSPQSHISLFTVSPGATLLFLYQKDGVFEVTLGRQEFETFLNGKELLRRTQLKVGDQLKTRGLNITVVSVDSPSVKSSSSGGMSLAESLERRESRGAQGNPVQPQKKAGTSLDQMVPNSLMEAGLAGKKLPSFKFEFPKSRTDSVENVLTEHESPLSRTCLCSHCGRQFVCQLNEIKMIKAGADLKHLICPSCKGKGPSAKFWQLEQYGFKVLERLNRADDWFFETYRAKKLTGEDVLLRVVRTFDFDYRTYDRDLPGAIAAFRSGLIDHPRVPKVLESKFNDDDLLFVEEWIPGQSLRAINSEEAMSWPRQVGILFGVLEVLVHAHSKNLYHGRLNLDRVVYDFEREGSGGLFLRGFGLDNFLSKRYQGPGDVYRKVKDDREILLPFKLNNRASMVRRDLYQLGVMLYELNSKHQPFHELNRHDREKRLKEGATPTLRQLGSSLPPPLRDFVTRLLEHREESAFKSAPEALEALQGTGLVLLIP